MQSEEKKNTYCPPWIEPTKLRKRSCSLERPHFSVILSMLVQQYSRTLNIEEAEQEL